MSKKFLIILCVLVLGVVGFVIFAGKKDDASSNSTASAADPKEIVSDDHLTGSLDKKVVVLEYLDFQCPGCRSLFPSMSAAREKYGDQVTFVVRYFPLNNIHPNALAAARAAEAAGKQNKFFEMEAILFPNQDSWGTVNTTTAQTIFEGYAQQLGLDADTFKKDFADAITLDRINRDREKGSKMGVTGTPTVFINNEKLDINSQEDLNAAIEKAMTDAGLSVNPQSPQ